MTTIILIQRTFTTGVQGVVELRYLGAGLSDVATAAPDKMLLQTMLQTKGRANDL